ncbi:MAG: hypothetical protein GEU99_00640 [Luteitalea sp.]|nr:hypothetical protein [Luteitalea sp.]
MARAQRYQKRGGDAVHVPLDDALELAQDPSRELLALDEALKGLAAVDQRKHRVIELRFFEGLTIEETAAVLEVSPDTVQRDSRLARVWLLGAMADQPNPGSGDA